MGELMKPLWIVVICLVSVAAHAAEFPKSPVQQIGTTIQQTVGVQKDPWEPDKRFNYIDPKSGLRTDGFVEKDQWEPKDRWNRYGESGRYEGNWQRDKWEDDRWNYTPATTDYNDGIGEYDDGIGTSAP
jgi:hypothetical protein